MWSWQCSNYPFLCHQNNISNFNLINRNGNFVCWAEEDGREKSVKCEGQFFNSEMTVLHSAFPSHLPSPPFDAEWEAEFDKKLELFLDVALCRAAQANTRSLPRSRLLILTGIHQLNCLKSRNLGRKERKGGKGGRKGIGIFGRRRRGTQNMRLQTSNCRDKNAITFRTFIRDNTRLLCYGVIRALISLSAPSKRHTEFHTLCQRKECSNRGGREGGGNTAEFQGRKEINFMRRTKSNS